MTLDCGTTGRWPLRSERESTGFQGACRGNEFGPGATTIAGAFYPASASGDLAVPDRTPGDGREYANPVSVPEHMVALADHAVHEHDLDGLAWDGQCRQQLCDRSLIWKRQPQRLARLDPRMQAAKVAKEPHIDFDHRKVPRTATGGEVERITSQDGNRILAMQQPSLDLRKVLSIQQPHLAGENTQPVAIVHPTVDA